MRWLRPSRSYVLAPRYSLSCTAQNPESDGRESRLLISSWNASDTQTITMTLTRTFLILTGIGVVCIFTGQTTDFSAVCVRCLRQERGLEYRTFGVLLP